MISRQRYQDMPKCNRVEHGQQCSIVQESFNIKFGYIVFLTVLSLREKIVETGITSEEDYQYSKPMFDEYLNKQKMIFPTS